MHGPREHTRNQKDNHDYKVNAFDLLFVDYSQDIVKSALVLNDAPHIVRFKETNEYEPENRKDKTNDGNRFSR